MPSKSKSKSKVVEKIEDPDDQNEFDQEDHYEEEVDDESEIKNNKNNKHKNAKNTKSNVNKIKKKTSDNNSEIFAKKNNKKENNDRKDRKNRKEAQDDQDDQDGQEDQEDQDNQDDQDDKDLKDSSDISDMADGEVVSDAFDYDVKKSQHAEHSDDKIDEEAQKEYFQTVVLDRVVKYIKIDNVIKEKQDQHKKDMKAIKDAKDQLEVFLLEYLDNMDEEYIQLGKTSTLLKTETKTKLAPKMEDISYCILEGFKKYELYDDEDELKRVVKDFVETIDAKREVKTRKYLKRMTGDPNEEKKKGRKKKDNKDDKEQDNINDYAIDEEQQQQQEQKQKEKHSDKPSKKIVKKVKKLNKDE